LLAVVLAVFVRQVVVVQVVFFTQHRNHLRQLTTQLQSVLAVLELLMKMFQVQAVMTLNLVL
jgi:hypothetical protein